MDKDMKNILKLNYPASWWGALWRDALPAGNGSIGALVYGGVYEETVMFSHEDLWWKSRTQDIPDVSSKLPEVRKRLLKGDAPSAEYIISDALKEGGYNPKVACPLPLGDLKVVMPGKNAFKNYSRCLDMETGEITVSWNDGATKYTRSLFVSRNEDMIVYKIEKDGPEMIKAGLFMDLHDRRDVTTPFNQPPSNLPQGFETLSEDSFIFYAAQNEDGTDFGAVLRVISKGGSMTTEKNGCKVSDAEEILIFCKLFIKGSRKIDWERLKQELEDMHFSYDEMQILHRQEHARLFNSVKFDLCASGRELSNEELLLDAYKGEASGALLEKMWAYGRYLLISSSREGGNPCPLMGLWCGEYEGFWAFNMANENLQMNYWQALSGNMPELLLSVFDYYEGFLDDFRINAERLYGCRGIYIPAVTSPESGLLKDLQPHIIHWTGAAGWIGQHYYDYYRYTGDIEFLRNRALPFLKEVALFYEDFFILGEDGYYISCPSNSPENTPGNYWRSDGKLTDMSTAINATMDFAIAREVLNHLVEGAVAAGIYIDEVDKWKEMLKRVPPYQINEDGAVKEWMHPYFTDNYHHRHQSHIYPVFPGTEVTRDNNNELFEAFVTAVKKRLVIGLKEQSGWSLAHMANNYARFGEGDLSLECLDILSRSCVMNNFFTTHNDWRGMGIGVDMDWAPFQIDANMGWTAAIQEMLLFSVPGEISILHALPKRWRKGFVGPLLARGAVEVCIKWDKEVGSLEVELKSRNRNQEVVLTLPKDVLGAEGEIMQNNKVMVKLKKGEKVKFNYKF